MIDTTWQNQKKMNIKSYILLLKNCIIKTNL